MKKMINVSPILPSGERGSSAWVAETEEQEAAREAPISAYERLQIAGVNLARLEGEKRDLEQQLRVMTEDRDEYRAASETYRRGAYRASNEREEYRRDLMETEKRLDVLLEEKARREGRIRANDDDLEQLFLVWCESGQRSPRRAHTSHESAKAEATRLAKANPGYRFYVLYTIGNASTMVPDVQWVLSDARFDDRSEIPF